MVAMAREARGRYLSAPFRSQALVWGCIALVSMLAPVAAGQLLVASLLESLNLSPYPHSMKPPEFNGQTVEAPTVSLASLRGRVALLNFWASWCRDCRSEMPMFEQLHRDFAVQGLTILGVNVREGTRTIRRYAKEWDLTFPLALDPKGKITASYGVIGLPTTFLIGRDGRPVALAIGPRHWDTAPARTIIQTPLAEPEVQKREP
jgi:peroxiredoxin